MHGNDIPQVWASGLPLPLSRKVRKKRKGVLAVLAFIFKSLKEKNGTTY